MTTEVAIPDCVTTKKTQRPDGTMKFTGQDGTLKEHYIILKLSYLASVTRNKHNSRGGAAGAEFKLPIFSLDDLRSSRSTMVARY